MATFKHCNLVRTALINEVKQISPLPNNPSYQEILTKYAKHYDFKNQNEILKLSEQLTQDIQLNAKKYNDILITPLSFIEECFNTHFFIIDALFLENNVTEGKYFEQLFHLYTACFNYVNAVHSMYSLNAIAQGNYLLYNRVSRQVGIIHAFEEQLNQVTFKKRTGKQPLISEETLHSLHRITFLIELTYAKILCLYGEIERSKSCITRCNHLISILGKTIGAKEVQATKETIKECATLIKNLEQSPPPLHPILRKLAPLTDNINTLEQFTLFGIVNAKGHDAQTQNDIMELLEIESKKVDALNQSEKENGESRDLASIEKSIDKGISLLKQIRVVPNNMALNKELLRKLFGLVCKWRLYFDTKAPDLLTKRIIEILDFCCKKCTLAIQHCADVKLLPSNFTIDHFLAKGINALNLANQSAEQTNSESKEASSKLCNKDITAKSSTKKKSSSKKTSQQADSETINLKKALLKSAKQRKKATNIIIGSEKATAYALAQEKETEQQPILEEKTEVNQGKVSYELGSKNRTLYQVEIPELVKNMMMIVHNAGYMLCIKGGYLRDFIMGIKPNDIDLITDCPKEKLLSILPDYYDFKQNKNESSLFKRFGHGLTLDIDIVCITTSIEDNLKKADFSFNTLTCSDMDGWIEDRLGFLNDVETKTWRTLSEPYALFENHPEMIVRAIRFSQHIPFPEASHPIMKAIFAKACFIPQLPFGIYLANFGKLFLKGNATQTLNFLITHQLLFSIIPFIIEKDCEFYADGWRNLCNHLDNLPSYLVKNYQSLTVLALFLYPLREHCNSFFEKHTKLSAQEKADIISKLVDVYNTRDALGRFLEGPQKLYNPALKNASISTLKPNFFKSVEHYKKKANASDDNPFTQLIEKGYKSYQQVKSAFQ